MGQVEMAASLLSHVHKSNTMATIWLIELETSWVERWFEVRGDKKKTFKELVQASVVME
jgi:hypothetical protein